MQFRKSKPPKIRIKGGGGCSGGRVFQKFLTANRSGFGLGNRLGRMAGAAANGRLKEAQGFSVIGRGGGSWSSVVRLKKTDSHSQIEIGAA